MFKKILQICSVLYLLATLIVGCGTIIDFRDTDGSGNDLSSSSDILFSVIVAYYDTAGNVFIDGTLVKNELPGPIIYTGVTANHIASYQYETATDVSVGASPNAGYVFIRWVVDGTSFVFANPIVLTDDTDVQVSAEFFKI